MKTFIILPARINSTRLPKKLIKKIGDKTLIEHMIITAKKLKMQLLLFLQIQLLFMSMQ